jgi:anti-sigma-K factor RskA
LPRPTRLVSYAVSVLVAVPIYWPKRWRDDIYDVVADSLSTWPPTTPMKLRRNLALGYQEAIAKGLKLARGWRGQAMKFRILLLATAFVVIFAGVNSYLASQHPTTTPPTHIVIDPTHR